MIRRKTCLIGALIANAFAASSWAAVSAEEAKQLGGPVLTAIGAERAGNKEGTIPAYTGETFKKPAGFGSDPKDPWKRPMPDVLAKERPLYSITAQNVAQYADKLHGMAEMFKIYPNYRMDIYPTHRSASYPKYVIDNTLKNATSCKALDNELRLEGCWGGFAFPIPKTGAEIMWNKLTSFRGTYWGGFSNSYVVPTDGNYSLFVGNRFWEQSQYFKANATAPATGKTLYFQFRMHSETPARRNGEMLALLNPVDVLNVGDRAYLYVPGQRRVKLAPNLSYDTPSPSGGGSSTMDDAALFSGAIDRYDWKLLGKKEKYLVYNNFAMVDHVTCDDQKIHTKNFPNPDCLRWELHRVWAVEGKLKPGFRHIYPSRRFYFDEDSYQAGLSENYDAAGKLFRVVLAYAWPWYGDEGHAGGAMNAESTAHLDVRSGVWASQGSHANVGAGLGQWEKPMPEHYFSPESMASEGVR